MSAPAGTISVDFHDYPTMVEAFRAIKDHIAISNANLDTLCNLGDGFVDKVLGPTNAKGLGPKGLDAMLWALAIRGTFTIDLDRVKQMKAHWEQRCAANTRTVPNRISKKLIERAKPEIFSEMGRKSALARMHCLTDEQRIKIARKAARKSGRWKKLSVQERRVLAQRAANARWAKARGECG